MNRREAARQTPVSSIKFDFNIQLVIAPIALLTRSHRRLQSISFLVGASLRTYYARILQFIRGRRGRPNWWTPPSLWYSNKPLRPSLDGWLVIVQAAHSALNDREQVLRLKAPYLPHISVGEAKRS
jgi:hypothetical protein